MLLIFQRPEVNELFSLKYSLAVHNDSTVQSPKGILPPVQLPPVQCLLQFNSKVSKDSKYSKGNKRQSYFIFPQNFHQIISPPRPPSTHTRNQQQQKQQQQQQKPKTENVSHSPFDSENKCDCSESIFGTKLAKRNISSQKYSCNGAFGALKKLFPNTHNKEKTNKWNLENAISTFRNCDRSKLTFCTILAKMNISMVKTFVQRMSWNFKTTLP